MKYKSINLLTLILIFVLISCTPETKENKMKENEITIIGTAYNGKGGALVITDNKETYYIEALDFWKDSIIEKKVEVNGYIYSEIFKEEDLKDETGAWKQGMIGEKSTITKAKWKLIE